MEFTIHDGLMLSVLLRFTDSDYPRGIFKLFLSPVAMVIGSIRIAQLVHVPLQALYIVAKKVGSISRPLDTSH